MLRWISLCIILGKNFQWATYNRPMHPTSPLYSDTYINLISPCIIVKYAAWHMHDWTGHHPALDGPSWICSSIDWLSVVISPSWKSTLIIAREWLKNRLWLKPGVFMNIYEVALTIKVNPMWYFIAGMLSRGKSFKLD